MSIDDKNEKKLEPLIPAKPHIVVVDDDPLFVRLLQRVAEKERIHLTVITSPQEAYQNLSTIDYDVGLFDYDLGSMTGIDLCKHLQEEGRKRPVMLVSNHGEIEKSKWPDSVKKSLPKISGPYSILTVARKYFEDAKRGKLKP